MKFLPAAVLVAAAAVVFPVGQLAGDRAADRASRREIGRELIRRHTEIERLRSAVARGVPYPLRALAVIGACESSGNPRAVSPGGRYRGFLQWDTETWRSVGGHGDPIQASFAEQWARGLLLFDARGTQPWPTCRQGVR